MRSTPLVLAIDDDVNILEIISIHLKNGGFQVETATNFNFGFKKAKELRPDLILLDIGMSETNGTEGILEIKENDQTKDVKVVFLTNITDPWPMIKDATKAAKELGAEAFLDKTKDLEKLAEKIKEILK